MNVEILEFYPLEKNESGTKINGTIRVRLPDIGVQILGIYVTKKNNTWFFNLPKKNGVDKNTGEKIFYRTFLFEDHEKNADMINAIREKGIEFIENQMKDPENLSRFDAKKTDETEQKKTTARNQSKFSKKI